MPSFAPVYKPGRDPIPIFLERMRLRSGVTRQTTDIQRVSMMRGVSENRVGTGISETKLKALMTYLKRKHEKIK